MTTGANVFEVFSGIQGEGVCVGCRQVFVRFSGCNLSCAYCDTPRARQMVLFAQVERGAGARRFEPLPNPMPAAELAAAIARLDEGRRHHAVSLTGGEPLLEADFIAGLIPQCGGRRFYLETNGTLPRALEKVIDRVDIVATDIKLRSSTRPSAEPAEGVADPAIARDFLAVAAKREVFVKVVVTDRATEGEVEAAARVVASVGARIPLVIQPVTSTRPDIQPPDPELMLELQAAALRLLDDVRVIPQTHKLIGQM